MVVVASGMLTPQVVERYTNTGKNLEVRVMVYMYNSICPRKQPTIQWGYLVKWINSIWQHTTELWEKSSIHHVYF